MTKQGNKVSESVTYVGGKKSRYPVILTESTELSQSIAAHVSDATRIVVVVDSKVYTLHKTTVRNLARALPVKSILISLPISEKKKNARSLLKLVDELIESGVDRSSFVLAIGGGVTTDLAGCAAALCLRGIRWGAIPTTLLAMVDAAIGGKTGVNTTAGKNLLGAFWQPEFVALAPEFTATQKDREFRDGLAEVVKYNAISGKPSIRSINALLAKGERPSDKTLAKVIFQSAKVKASIVSKDEREQGVRVWLNFGHTFAHALESAAGYGTISHGRAVAAGILGALALSEAKGLVADARIESVRNSAQSIASGKAVSIDEKAAFAALGMDKKRRGDRLNFVLLRTVAEPYLAEMSDRRLIRRALKIAIKSLSA
jgi:3-dehydroquinate synthase